MNGKVLEHDWESEAKQIECEKQLKELGDVEAELNILPLKKEELKTRGTTEKPAEELNISGADFMFLMDLIVEENANS